MYSSVTVLVRHGQLGHTLVRSTRIIFVSKWKHGPKGFRMSAGQKLDDEYWRKRWVDGQITFHKPQVNPTLIKHIDEMTGGQEKCRVFVPLSGKSLDMKWLADRGHTVVGVEVSSLAIEDFFKENSVDYSSSPVDGITEASLYSSKDSSILLYQANLFSLNRDILGQFDCIWDRASLVAVSREDVKRYADLMGTLTKPHGRCLLSTMDYDQSKMNGPPFSTPVKVVEQVYAASDWDIRVLEEIDGLNEKWRSRGLSTVTDRTYLLTKKDK